MKASELVKILTKDIERYGDLEVCFPTGEMGDPESVVSVDVKDADISDTGMIFIPHKTGRITNSQVIYLNDY